MKLRLENLVIELENQQEIQDFWNVIMFALDLQAQRERQGESCMTDDELKLARKLEEITNLSWR